MRLKWAQAVPNLSEAQHPGMFNTRGCSSHALFVMRIIDSAVVEIIHCWCRRAHLSCGSSPSPPQLSGPRRSQTGLLSDARPFYPRRGHSDAATCLLQIPSRRRLKSHQGKEVVRYALHIAHCTLARHLEAGSHCNTCLPLRARGGGRVPECKGVLRNGEEITLDSNR